MTTNKKIITFMAVALFAVAALGIGVGAYTASQAEKSSVGKDRALAGALADAGISRERADYTRVKLDRDNGLWVYEVEFYAGGVEYDYKILAENGSIIEKETDGRKIDSSVSRPQSQRRQASSPSSQAAVTDAEKAKDIALQAAGVSRRDATFTASYLDRDDGIEYYEIDFYTSQYRYEYEVAADGSILKAEREPLIFNGASSRADSTSLIGVDRAKQIALDHSGASADSAYFEKAKLERDDGRTYYEIEFRYTGYEYEYDIDAVSGEIISFESDRD